MTNNTNKITFKEWKDNIKKNFSDKTKRKILAVKILAWFGVLFRTLILIGLCFVILLPIFQWKQW